MATAPVWLRSPHRALSGLSPDLAASVLAIAAFAVFSLMAVLMRMIGDRIAVGQVILVRQVIALLLLAPMFWQARGVILHPTGLGLHLARGLLMIGAMYCGLTAILHIPLADATAIGMAEVLIATAFAALILREPVGWRRWTATAIGFLGVLVMVRPFGAGFDAHALVALAGAVCGAASMIALRLGSAHDTTITVLFWQGLVVTLLALPLAAAGWAMPTAGEAVVLVAMGLAFTAGMWLHTAAIRLGRASSLAPLGYLRLVMMALVGWLIYAEVPSWSTVLGGALVMASATYTLTRNAAVRPPLSVVPPPAP